MCEFDTMSDKGEVLDAVYSSIMSSMSTQPSIEGFCARISDFRGVVEGTYRQKQYMLIMKRFLQEEGPMAIKVRLETILNQPLLNWKSVEQ